MAKSSSSGGLIITLVILAIAAGGGWYFWNRSAEKPPEVSTTTIAKGDIVQVVTATGDLQPVTSVDVSSQISGQIKEVLVDFNTPVKAGQVLAKLDPATYDQRLKQAQADLASTQANTNLVRLNTERTRELRQKNLVSQQELDQAEAQLAQANAQLQTRQASVDNANVDLSRCTLYAPIDGIVMDRLCDVGKTVAASLNAPTLFTIVNNLSKMQINAAVAEADIGSVEVGQQVNFTVDAFPNRQFRGKITLIRNAPKTSQSVVTYQTIIEVSNDDLRLKPGMTANVSIVIAQRSGVLKIANSALRVRIPEEVLQKRLLETKPAPAAPGAPAEAPAPKAMSEEELRNARRAIMRDAGMSPGSPPTPEIIQKAQQLAKERGIELDFSRMGGRGSRSEGGRSGASNAPVYRNVYRLAGPDPKTAQFEQVRVQLGISDGISTEVLDGLKENDVIVTSVTLPNSAAAHSPSTANPLMGGRGGPGGMGGRR
ncbi:MAG: efflux RND transporter periplasmic adaptor subunit [Opitutae bacterium]|nr:efflux RND transporter periplasmic adaptor subunit [Opitutae bacterium]